MPQNDQTKAHLELILDRDTMFARQLRKGYLPYVWHLSTTAIVRLVVIFALWGLFYANWSGPRPFLRILLPALAFQVVVEIAVVLVRAQAGRGAIVAANDEAARSELQVQEYLRGTHGTYRDSDIR